MNNSSSFKNKIRLLEIYSLTQGVLLAFLAGWFRFGLQVVKIDGPPDASAELQSARMVAYGLLALLFTALAGLIFVKSRLRSDILAVEEGRL